jgi:arylsulfatase A-like enzyme
MNQAPQERNRLKIGCGLAHAEAHECRPNTIAPRAILMVRISLSVLLSHRLELFRAPHCLSVMNTFSMGNSRSKWSCFLVAFFTLFSTLAQTNVSHSSVTNPPPAPRRPSILLIVADNVGYGDLGCYGQTKVKTPHLDQLAKEGIRFTSFYAGSPNDQPSRASLLTGLEPKHIAASFSHPLPMDAVTIAAMLKEIGYHTGLMGEWNLGDTAPVEPNTKGFEEFGGFLSQNHARDYFSDNVYRQELPSGTNRLLSLPENWARGQGLYLPDFVGEMGGNYIRTRVPDAFNRYAPFFLCLAYPVPHNGPPPHTSPYSRLSWPQPEKDRAAMIAHLDNSVGEVLFALTRWRLETNTVVIFTSFGGVQPEGAMDPKFFNASGPLRGQAGSVYEGGIRVPMIIRWPARIKAGQVTDFPCAAWDILPTAMEIAFSKPSQKTDGFSLLPVLTGKGKTNVHESFYWDSNEENSQQAARMGDWKIVRLGTNAPALYNLKTDIGERNDVADKNADVLKKLKNLLAEPSK